MDGIYSIDIDLETGQAFVAAKQGDDSVEVVRIDKGCSAVVDRSSVSMGGEPAFVKVDQGNFGVLPFLIEATQIEPSAPADMLFSIEGVDDSPSFSRDDFYKPDDNPLVVTPPAQGHIPPSAPELKVASSNIQIWSSDPTGIRGYLAGSSPGLAHEQEIKPQSVIRLPKISWTSTASKRVPILVIGRESGEVDSYSFDYSAGARDAAPIAQIGHLSSQLNPAGGSRITGLAGSPKSQAVFVSSSNGVALVQGDYLKPVAFGSTYEDPVATAQEPKGTAWCVSRGSGTIVMAYRESIRSDSSDSTEAMTTSSSWSSESSMSSSTLVLTTSSESSLTSVSSSTHLMSTSSRTEPSSSTVGRSTTSSSQTEEPVYDYWMWASDTPSLVSRRIVHMDFYGATEDTAPGGEIALHIETFYNPYSGPELPNPLWLSQWIVEARHVESGEVLAYGASEPAYRGTTSGSVVIMVERNSSGISGFITFTGDEYELAADITVKGVSRTFLDETPTMTGTSEPAPYRAYGGTSTLALDNYAWKYFRHSCTALSAVDRQAGYKIVLDYGSNAANWRSIKEYAVSFPTNNNNTPYSLVFSGSYDMKHWQVLHSISGIGYSNASQCPLGVSQGFPYDLPNRHTLARATGKNSCLPCGFYSRPFSNQEFFRYYMLTAPLVRTSSTAYSPSATFSAFDLYLSGPVQGVSPQLCDHWVTSGGVADGVTVTFFPTNANLGNTDEGNVIMVLDTISGQRVRILKGSYLPDGPITVVSTDIVAEGFYSYAYGVPIAPFINVVMSERNNSGLSGYVKITWAPWVTTGQKLNMNAVLLASCRNDTLST